MQNPHCFIAVLVTHFQLSIVKTRPLLISQFFLANHFQLVIIKTKLKASNDSLSTDSTNFKSHLSPEGQPEDSYF